MVEAFEISSSLIFFFCFAFAATAAAVVFLLLHSFFPLFLPIFCFHYDVNDDFTANRELLFFLLLFLKWVVKRRHKKCIRKRKYIRKKIMGRGKERNSDKTKTQIYLRKRKGKKSKKTKKEVSEIGKSEGNRSL